MPLYFSYGSNMDAGAMAARCPASRPLGAARLLRHRFTLMREGYATIVRDAAGAVHGLLWDLALRDVAALDRYEGVADGLYLKVQQSVLTRQGARRALVYVGTNAGGGSPPAGYLEQVIAGARACGLPASYVAGLHAHFPGRGARSPGQG